MGIEPFLIAYAINLIVAQRLIRKICGKCKRKITSFDDALMEAAGLDINEWQQHTVYKAVGCDECSGTGYKGRMAIHEALYFTKEIRQIIVRSGAEVDEEKIRIQAKKDGSQNLRDAGLEKVKLGLTTIEEVLSTTTEE
jgi:type IV pilus assembly protein PilB